MMKSYVIDVQRCSIHDGPGIRTTVFLKGCPLKCQWCHNPESQCFDKELSFNVSLCTNCQRCVYECPRDVHQFIDGHHLVAYDKCIKCGLCVKACSTKALSIIGKDLTTQKVLDIVLKDSVFYEQDNGGITLSGGEALSHVQFCLELLKGCREHNIHTCIETSGYSPIGHIKLILPYVDLFLFDFKVSNEEDARTYIGGDLSTIQKSFNEIYNQGKDIILRCPIIPNVNDTKDHFDAIGQMMIKYPKLVGIELLPYHDFGVSKGENIGKTSERFDFPTDEQKQQWLHYFHSNGYNKVKLS